MTVAGTMMLLELIIAVVVYCVALSIPWALLTIGGSEYLSHLEWGLEMTHKSTRILIRIINRRGGGVLLVVLFYLPWVVIFLDNLLFLHEPLRSASMSVLPFALLLHVSTTWPEIFGLFYQRRRLLSGKSRLPTLSDVWIFRRCRHQPREHDRPRDEVA